MKKLKSLIQELYQDRKQLIFLAAIFSVGAYLDSFIPRDPHIQQAWVGAALAAIQIGVGIWQAVEGAKMAKGAERPEYETPQAMIDAMTTAERKAFEGLPSEVKKEFLQASQRMTASSLRQVGERRGGLGLIPQLYQKEMEGARQLSLMDVAAREKNLENLQKMRMNMAAYQQQEWQWEEAAPYQQTMQTAAALQGAGMQNIMGGVGTGVMAAGGGDFGGGGGMSKKQTAYSEYSAGMDVTNQARYQQYAKGAGTDIGYQSWKGMEGSTYENPFSYDQFKQHWRQQRRDNPNVQLPWRIYHDGGTVTGNNPNVGEEDVPAVLQEGEVVINADAAKQNVGLLSQINQSTGGNPLQSYTMQTLASQGGGTGLSEDITIQLALDESAPPSEAALNLFSNIETETTGLPTSLGTQLV